MDNLNVLNTKALERQVKVLETRIAEVQSELAELDKRRRACLILMGHDMELPVEAKPEAVAAEPKTSKPAPKKAKVDTALYARVSEVLSDSESPLSVEGICKVLAMSGAVKDAGKAKSSVETVLSDHAETFQADGDEWTLRTSEADGAEIANA